MMTLNTGNYMEFPNWGFERRNGEILADNYYALGINTLLFGILVDHVEEDYVPFCIEDFDRMRKSFINTGRPFIQNTFTYQELLDFLDNPSYFTYLGNNQYSADMNAILGDCNFTEEEIEFFGNDMRALKIFALFCRLNLDMRLTNDDLTVQLLRLQKFVK